MYLIKFKRHLQTRQQMHLLVGVICYGVNHNPEFALINYHAPILMIARCYIIFFECSWYFLHPIIIILYIASVGMYSGCVHHINLTVIAYNYTLLKISGGWGSFMQWYLSGHPSSDPGWRSCVGSVVGIISLRIYLYESWYDFKFFCNYGKTKCCCTVKHG